MENNQKEHLYKILVIGDLGVGKTSIIKRYVHQNFSPNYRATIGVDFALKVLNWETETIRLQLWDIAAANSIWRAENTLEVRLKKIMSQHMTLLCASNNPLWDHGIYGMQNFSLWPEAGFSKDGQERFGNMTRVYYREAMGAIIVFDVTRPSTFEAVTKWKDDLDSKLTLSNGKNIAAVLLANKCDQGRDVLTNNGIKMEQFCKDNGFVGWFETSAKENINIDEAANCLVKHVIANENDILQSEVPDTISPQFDSTRNGTCSACFKS